MPVSDYNLEAGLNVSISGINIAEGCSPAGINDAIRQLMADVKAESQALAAKATASAVGRVKLSDSTSGTNKAASGVAASEYAVKLAYDRGTAGVNAAATAQTAASNAQNTANGKAPTAHASTGTTYGIGTGSNYGHVKLSDATNSTSAASAGVAASPKAVKAAYDKAASAVPAGTVIAFAGNPGSAPSGYLLCNGAKVSRTTYAALYSAIGTKYGTGDGSTTFTLPNLTDRFLQGSGTAGTTKAAGLPNITGHLPFYSVFRDEYGSSGSFYSKSVSFNVWYASLSTSQKTEITTFDASRSSSVYGASTTVQPPAVTMRFYIKY